LELIVTSASSTIKDLLSTITSTELRKIIFSTRYMDDWRTSPPRMEGWDLIDEQLCGLVDRLCATGYRYTLEVEMESMKAEGSPEYDNFTKVFPKFREKGIVTVIDAGFGPQVFHGR
jgi:hypothetical protein